MNINNTYWQVVETTEDLEELKLMANEMTREELASHYGTSYGKMTSILRYYEVKAKPKERIKKLKKPKILKKDHELLHWVNCTNKGKIRHVYYNMIRRCSDSTRREYPHYGGRGIQVCDEWKNDCCVFYRWARDNGYREGVQLDRINNDGNYCPENCRWVTPKENVNNRSNTRLITYRGELKSLSKWSEELNIPYSVLADRIFKYKWNIELATSEPYIPK